VWDRATTSWVATGLGEAEAHQRAMDLDVINSAYGQRSPADRREVRPARPVDVCLWTPAGELDWWVRERRRWWGRVRGEGGRLRWLSADRLRLHRADCQEGAEREDGSEPGR